MIKETMHVPYYTVNTLTGTKSASVIEDPREAAEIIVRSRNPLYIIGPVALSIELEEGILLKYVIDIADKINIATCATAHVKKKMLEFGKKPDSVYDIIEIINFLKMKDWQGVRGWGQHDLVLVTGIRADLAAAGLSTLKHYAPHLRTLAICNAGHPHADYTAPVFKKVEKFQKYLEDLREELSEVDV